MQQLRKDNHYVPQLYLKQWSRNGKIPTYRLLVPNDNCDHWKEHSAKSIAFHQHLYTYVVGQGETDEFERWLDREFENPAEEAINRAINGERLSRDNWSQLIRFLAAQDVRTPVRLKEFLTRQNETFQSFIDATLANSVAELEKAARLGIRLQTPKRDPNDIFPVKVTVARSTEGGGIIQAKGIVGRRLWLACSRHMLTSTISYLMAHRWTILHAPEGVTWPTSDNPVIRLNFVDANNYDFRGGWGRKNGEILLPLSSTHLLYTKIGNRTFSRGTVLDEGTARMIRRMLIEHADRFVFALDKGDIHLIRPRKVCSETYKREQLAWKNWHHEQSQAEAGLSL
jgi:hypothetical protein